MPSFSIRYNLRESDNSIIVTNDAPEVFRLWLIYLVKSLEVSIEKIRASVCACTYQAEDRNNWSPNDFMLSEAQDKLLQAQWYYVYDVAEDLYKQLPLNKKGVYVEELNTFFYTNGYGWQINNDGIILRRGNVIENNNFASALDALAHLSTAQNELKNALQDLSKRPEPDLTGSVHHSLASIECLLRDMFNASGESLGNIIKNNRKKFTSPLDLVIGQLWGYASNHGRHVGEGTEPTFEEAQFVLYTTSAIITFVTKIFNE